MKKQLFVIGAAAVLGCAACNDNGSTSNTTKSDSVTTQPGDTTVQTTTTTTTTTKTVHPIANFEHRTFYNVKTHKPVKLRMDTVMHYYVDMSTNHEPDYYYYDPATKDTFDYWGRRLNNALVNDNGNWTLDESKIDAEYNTPSTTATSDTASMNTTNPNSKMKIKQKDDVTKTKIKNK